MTNKFSTSFCRGSTDCASVDVSPSGVPAWILIASQALSNISSIPVPLKTLSHLSNFLTLSANHDDKRKELQNDHHGLGVRLFRMRRMEVVCTESSSSKSQEHLMESLHSPKDVQTEHVSFQVLALTFHQQFSPVDLVAFPDVMLHQSVRPERTATARISCALWVPTSDFFFPSIIRSTCLCREIKKCAGVANV